MPAKTKGVYARRVPAKKVREIAVEMNILSSCVLPNSEMSALYGVQYIVMKR